MACIGIGTLLKGLLDRIDDTWHEEWCALSNSLAPATRSSVRAADLAARSRRCQLSSFPSPAAHASSSSSSHAEEDVTPTRAGNGCRRRGVQWRGRPSHGWHARVALIKQA